MALEDKQPGEGLLSFVIFVYFQSCSHILLDTEAVFLVMCDLSMNVL